MKTTIINAESIKATGIEPTEWNYNREGELLYNTVTYKDKQEAVAAMKEFLNNLNMDNLPEKIDLRLKTYEWQTKCSVIEVMRFEDRPWA